MSHDPDPAAGRAAAEKERWRAQLTSRRRRRSPTERQAAQAAVSAHLVDLCVSGSTLCGYLPLPSEPLDPAALPRMAAAGVTVLLPVATADSPLDWCRWTDGATRRGAFGIEEPTGPRLGARGIIDANVVLVPALAVDLAGNRLGRGGGHYDRSLALLSALACGDRQASAPRLIAVVYDDEVVVSLPHGLLDHRVTEVVTPSGGLRTLG